MYSTEPAAKLLEYHEYRKDEKLTCPRCGWSGQAGEAATELYRELFDVSCPVCDIDNPDHRERPDDEIWTVIRCGERVIWRELAYWEGWERFNEVKDILKRCYGNRFASLEPSNASEL
jgi:hypothetical protein